MEETFMNFLDFPIVVLLNVLYSCCAFCFGNSSLLFLILFCIWLSFYILRNELRTLLSLPNEGKST